MKSVRAIVIRTIVILCAAAQGVKAENDKSSGPLSFYRINADERISFGVSTSTPECGLMIFDIDVYSSPKPRAIIYLQINAAMGIHAAEKAWGHNVDVKVEKALSDSDMRFLQGFLLKYRANGDYDVHSNALQGFQEFTMEKQVKNNWGLEKREDYNRKGREDRQFIKEFVGFDSGNPANGFK